MGGALLGLGVGTLLAAPYVARPACLFTLRRQPTIRRPTLIAPVSLRAAASGLLRAILIVSFADARTALVLSPCRRYA